MEKIKKANKIVWITMCFICMCCNAFSTACLLADMSVGTFGLIEGFGLLMIFGGMLTVMPAIFLWVILSGRAES